MYPPPPLFLLLSSFVVISMPPCLHAQGATDLAEAAAEVNKEQRLYSNVCEEQQEDGSILYSACTSEPVPILSPGNSILDLTVTDGMTCGETNQPYCTLGLRDCGYCNNTIPTLTHPKSNMVDGDDTTRWQSITWSEYPTPLHVNITLAFDKLYELQDNLLIRFQSSRPQEAILERSVDFGANWTVWQYYSKRCKDYYDEGMASAVPASEPETVICSQDYSGQLPYQDGEVRFPIVQDRYSLFLGESLTDYPRLYQAFNTTEINSFLQFTSIRVRLLYPATDGKESLRKEEDLIRYYYAIENIVITAGCSCNLHAKYCVDKDGKTVCECQHNTEGDNCEKCLPLYNNRQWEPGYYVPYPNGTANACQKCTCNDHADTCVYDRAKGHGVCQDCYHNTTGDFCHQCRPGYFKNLTLEADDPQICVDCDCELLGVQDNNTDCEVPGGDCQCKNNVEGRRCDICRDQFYGLLMMDNDPGTCKVCDCNLDGTAGASNVCEKQAGQCPCKPNTASRDCSECRDGGYRFPNGRRDLDCLDCGCDPGGSVTLVCDKVTGQCPCQPFTSGQHCDGVEMGYYAPALDANQLQPNPIGGTTCQLDTALVSENYPFTGRTFYRCSQDEVAGFQGVEGDLRQPSLQWPYYFTVRYSLEGSQPWQSAIVGLRVEGNSGIVDLTPYTEGDTGVIDRDCPLAPGRNYDFEMTDLPSGIGLAWQAPESVSIDVRCRYTANVLVQAPGNSTVDLMLDSIVLIPDQNNSRVFQVADPGTQQSYLDCIQQVAALSSRSDAVDEMTCRDFIFATTTELAAGGLECDCDPAGTVSGTVCQPHGGQCSCKSGTYGRRCDVCEPGYYNFTNSGCKPCDCSELGSANLVCDYDSGQCPCRPRVAAAGDENVLDLVDDLQCQACLKDHFGFQTGEGCELCLCSELGSDHSQCNDTGHCVCHDTIQGDKCDICESGYFAFSADGCIMCNCTEAGSVSIDCHQGTGQCSCRSNVQGLKCESCAADSFNLQNLNPDGCQKCFCYGHGTMCTSAEGFTGLTVLEESTGTWPFSDPLDTGLQNYLEGPPSFLGDRLYAQSLSFTTRLVGPEVDTADYPMAVLVGRVQGNEKAVFYNGPNFHLNGEKDVELKLHYSYWFTNATQSVDYFNFYAILADLVGLHIRVNYGNSVLMIRDVVMVTAEAGGATEDAVPYVESCTCDRDRNVAGQSCEICAQGQQRSQPDDTSYEPCEACDCSGRGATSPPQCDQTTGQCLNCRDGTTGFNCEFCAANVEGIQCDTCLDEFWGLRSDGCRECNCSMPGSMGTVCDKVTGQCDCGDLGRHVVGGQCDQCEDNYFNLTPTGCEVCDDCYGLVAVEVNDLREMRDNLTLLVTLLKEEDNTTQLGDFHIRLQDTMDSMEVLLKFLTEANTVEGTVGPQVVHLNNTLNHLKEQVNVNAVLSIDQSNSSILHANDLLTQGKEVIEETKQTLVRADQQTSDTIDGYIRTLETLVDDLSYVQRTLGAVSDTALGGVIRTGQTVVSIETDSEKALILAGDALQEVQTTRDDHFDTSQRVDELEEYRRLMMAKNTQFTLATGFTSGNASALMQRALELDRNMTDMGVIEEDMEQLRQQADALKSRSEEVTAKVVEATTQDQSVIDRVQQAYDDTQPLLAQVNDLKAQADGLQLRMEEGSQRASEADTLEKQSFVDAENTLDIMKNFEDLAQDVEDQAEQSLSTVQDIRDVSETAITESEALTDALQVADVDSQQAKAVAQDSKTVATANTKAMEPVLSKANDLQRQTDTVLNDVDTKHDDVITANFTKIAPAWQSCERLSFDVIAMETKADLASRLAANISRDVNAASDRVDKATTDFQRVRDIDQDTIEELQRLLPLTEQEYRRRQLALEVEKAKKTVEENREWLDAMKAKKAQLQTEIRRLKDLREQLRT